MTNDFKHFTSVVKIRTRIMSLLNIRNYSDLIKSSDKIGFNAFYVRSINIKARLFFGIFTLPREI